LVADDVFVNQKMMLLILKKLGYGAQAAGNGLEVLEALERSIYDVILMDVNMPEMDGLEALREIKSANPEIAVVMITGNASSENVQEAIQNGASGFIVKPFNAAKVLSTLDRVLSAKTAKTG
jgi:two-component system chemotaxis response regulator CheY